MRARISLAVLGIAMAGVIAVAFGAGPRAAGIRVGEPAPEITGGPWINSESLSMQKLKGRVVYVEFWTYT
jgi:hypothetical protein